MKRCGFITIIAVFALFGRAAADTTYTWTDTSTNWGSAASWTPSGTPPVPNGGIPGSVAADLFDAITAFGPQGSIANQPGIGTSSYRVKGVTLNNSGGASWNITGNTGVLTIGTGGLTVTGG